MSFYKTYNQGSKGDKTMVDKLMLIHKIVPSIDYKKWLKRLDTKLNKETNQNSLINLKVVKPKNKKTLL